MIIAHTCTKCGHADFHRHDNRGGRNPDCPIPCGCLGCTPGESTLRPTFDRRGDVVERIIPPGERSVGGYIAACSCQECKDLYASLTKDLVSAGGGS